MSSLIDIKYALRMLFKAPKFTAMILGVLVGGLSISLFTFSFLYSTVYKPLPIPEGDTALAALVFYDGNAQYIKSDEFVGVKDKLDSFAELGVFDNRSVRLSVHDSGKNISGSYVDGGFFEFGRIKPILGRTIVAEDMEVGADPVAVISYDTWKNELAGTDDVLTRSLTLDNVKTRVIGVMPQEYRFPNFSKIWLPLSTERLTDNALSATELNVYARLKANVDIRLAEREISVAVNQIYQQNIKDYDFADFEKSVRLLTFPMAQTGGQGTIVFIFLNGIVWLILLLACINVGNLLLARAIEKQKETAIRAALGATTQRLVSQLMWEGVIISVLGGVLSLLLVGAALDYTDVALNSWIPSGGSFWWQYELDIETVMMAVVFTAVTILLSSFLPAWRSATQDISTTLRDGTRGAQSKKAGKLSRILVTAQVFIVALLMLIGSISGFIAHKFVNLELGDDYSNVMVARLTLPERKYESPQQKANLVQSLIEDIKQNPQVTNVMTNTYYSQSAVTIEGVEYISEQDKPIIDIITAVGDTETVGIGLVSGRQFQRTDTVNSPKAALISRSMARRYWLSESPLDKRINVDIDDEIHTVTIVGVVTDRMNPTTLFGKLDSADEVYLSGLQFPSNYLNLYYRHPANTTNNEEIFYRSMFRIDRTIELDYSVQPASRNRNKMRESMQIMSNITFGTGFFALLLAMVGIYGLAANTVAQRTHEIGIRRAVGASDQNIMTMFLRQGAKQLAIGLGGAIMIFGLLSMGFHEFTEGIFPVYSYFILSGLVVVGLSLVVMFAIYVPAKRAIVMEPSLALRYE